MRINKIAVLVFIGFLCSSFINIEEETTSKKNKIILGMILLKEDNSFNLKNMLKELRKDWNLNLVEDEEGDNKAAVFEIEGYRIAVANIPAPIPENEVELAAKYNYLWKNGVEETSKHKAHIVLSLINGGKDFVKENILFTKLASAVMNNSESIGLYIGGRTLVLKKDLYLESAADMNEDNLPLYNWVYFGFRKEKKRHSFYTYGLKDFGKKEIEILDSKKSIEELNDMIYNITHYVISGDITLKSGETIGVSATQKLKISESKGRYVDGETLKIKF